MKISEISKLLDAELLCGEEHLDSEVISACCSDMMSDVLAYVKDQGVLITGLTFLRTPTVNAAGVLFAENSTYRQNRGCHGGKSVTASARRAKSIRWNKKSLLGQTNPDSAYNQLV